MRVGLLFLPLLLACGRLGFDELGSNATAPPLEDGLIGVTCNGTEGTAGDVIHPLAAVTAPPDVIWTGREFAATWESMTDGDPEIYFARIAPDGALLGDVLRVTNAAGYSFEPSIAWTGSQYAIAWSDWRDGNVGGEIYFAAVDGSGAKLGSDVRITNVPYGSYSPKLVAEGEGLALFWIDDGPSNFTRALWFARLDVGGTAAGSHVDLGSLISGLSVVSTDEGFGAMWTFDCCDGDENVDLARVTPDGTRQAADRRIASPSAEGPTLTWNGDGFGATWNDSSGGSWAPYFGQLARDGTVIRSGPLEGLTGLYASIVWNGSGYAAVGANGNDIELVELDASGTLIKGPTSIGYVDSPPDRPIRLLWTGDGYAAIWSGGGAGTDIYLARACL